MSLNFGQIPPLTRELAALKCLKNLLVTRTCIIPWMSLNLGQIRPLTTELAALEHLKKPRPIMGKVASLLFSVVFGPILLASLECLKN